MQRALRSPLNRPLPCTSMKSEPERWLGKDQELQLQQVLVTTRCLKAHIENKVTQTARIQQKALTSGPMHATFFKESLKMKKTGRQDHFLCRFTTCLNSYSIICFQQLAEAEVGTLAWQTSLQESTAQLCIGHHPCTWQQGRFATTISTL